MKSDYSEIEQRMIQLQKELTNVYNSTSWKITRPYRFLGKIIRKASKRILPKKVLSALHVLRNEGLIGFCLKVKSKFKKNTTECLNTPSSTTLNTEQKTEKCNSDINDKISPVDIISAKKSFSISVVIVAYNQEKYISQAIESVLAQDLSCVREIIISDDGSTDGTLRIAKSYAAKNPLIKIIENDTLFDSRFAKIPAALHMRIRDNYIRAFSAASGDYIAVLEGDDYWYGGKLAFMYKRFRDPKFDREKYSFFFHKYDALQANEIKPRYYQHEADSEIDVHESIRAYDVQNLSSVVFDSSVVKGVLGEFADITGVDYSLTILCLRQRPAYFFASPFSVYRISENGVWSRLSDEQKEIRNIEGRMLLNSFFKNEYKEDFYFGIDEAVKRYTNVRGGYTFYKPSVSWKASTRRFYLGTGSCRLTSTIRKDGLSSFCKASENSRRGLSDKMAGEF